MSGLIEETPDLALHPALENEIPLWFWQEIDAGLEGLASCRLRYRPQTEVDMKDNMEAVAIALCKGRRWNPDHDVQRIRMGFHMLSLNQTDWPPPAVILDAILTAPVPSPPVPPPANHDQLALPAPMMELSPGAQRIREALRVLPDTRARLKFITLTLGWCLDARDARPTMDRQAALIEACDFVMNRYGSGT